VRPNIPKLLRWFHGLAPRAAWHVWWFGLLLLFNVTSAIAQMLPGGYDGPTNTPLASWSFHDPTNWTSDQGRSPISFTNLNYSWLGDGTSLVVNTNLPAWLNFNIVEPSTGATNLVLNASGSITFWYAADWSTTNGGPGQWSELIDVGEWTTNSSYGYFGLSIDSAGSNLWFLAQDGAGSTYGLSTLISWTTNYFHYVALTYSSTNVSIYLDGQLAANDPGGLSTWPRTNALAGGAYFGSDTNGLMQAAGLFNTVETYSYPLSSNDVQKIFNWNYGYYMMSPWNTAMFSIISAPSTPSTTPTFNAVTGSGFLTAVTTNTSCITSSNVWITNISAFAVGTNMAVQFTITGGSNGIPYDVFANSVLDFSSNTNLSWAWMGQGYQCVTYILTNLPTTACFIILGTPQDADSDGLTDAYERLVSKTDPNNPNSSGDRMLDGWKVLWGMNPSINNSAQPGERANFLYDGISRLKSDTGIVNEAFGFDAQGNIQLDQP